MAQACHCSAKLSRAASPAVILGCSSTANSYIRIAAGSAPPTQTQIIGPSGHPSHRNVGDRHRGESRSSSHARAWHLPLWAASSSIEHRTEGTALCAAGLRVCVCSTIYPRRLTLQMEKSSRQSTRRKLWTTAGARVPGAEISTVPTTTTTTTTICLLALQADLPRPPLPGACRLRNAAL